MEPLDDFQEYVSQDLEKAAEETGLNFNYEIGSNGVFFRAEVSGSAGLDAQVTYQADEDSLSSRSATGKLQVQVSDDGEVLYDRSVSATLEGSGRDKNILVYVPVEGQTPRATGDLRETAEGALSLAQDFVSSPSVLRYNQMMENSVAVRNDASTELQKNVQNKINEDGSYPASPLRKFGKGLKGTRYPSKDEEEVREELNNSREVQKWRELGEKLSSGELEKDTFDEIVDSLERNPDKTVTDFAV